MNVRKVDLSHEDRQRLKKAVSEYHRKRLKLDEYTGRGRPEGAASRKRARMRIRNPCQAMTGSGAPCSFNAPQGESYCSRHKASLAA